MIDDAASRRSCSISRRVRSRASLAPSENFSTASAREPASISKTSGSSPPGVSSWVSPEYRMARVASGAPVLVTGVSTRIVPIFRSVKVSSRYRDVASILSSAFGVLMGCRIAHAPALRERACRWPAAGRNP
jgi:hypothetical protein